jgi:HAD superfamily hydrolase (TIGR01549 family)
VTTARILRRYREAHEELRALGKGDQPLAPYQISRTAQDLGLDRQLVAATVEEWMVRRPLKYLRWCRRPNLKPLLTALGGAGLRLGVLSDYDPAVKLNALEVAGHFSLALCTTDANVNALKPHPRGFQVACELWGVKPEEVLYVGDRPNVDGQGATAAGLGCAILAHRPSPGREQRWIGIRQLDDLHGYILSAR